jgi:signal peptidase I
MQDINNKNGKKITAKIITKDWILPIAIALVLASTIRSYALSRVNVDGPSMQSTLKNNDVMFEEKISRYLHDIKRGDIITFNSHDPLRPSYIKRVIGLA